MRIPTSRVHAGVSARPRHRRTIWLGNIPHDDPARLALAQEVIVSCGNILAAAGFRRDEIAGFLRQAADQLASANLAGTRAEPVRDHPAAPPVRSAAPAASLADIARDFAGIAPVRALTRLAADRQLGAGLHGEPARSHIGLALEMLPQLAEAQGWLRDAAREAGFELVTDRREWLATATPEGRLRSDRIVFLDDWEMPYRSCFDFLAALVASTIRDRDTETLQALLHGLVGCGIIVTSALKIELETAVATLIPRPDADTMR